MALNNLALKKAAQHLHRVGIVNRLRAVELIALDATCCLVHIQ